MGRIGDCPYVSYLSANTTSAFQEFTHNCSSSFRLFLFLVRINCVITSIIALNSFLDKSFHSQVQAFWSTSCASSHIPLGFSCIFFFFFFLFFFTLRLTVKSSSGFRICYQISNENLMCCLFFALLFVVARPFEAKYVPLLLLLYGLFWSAAMPRGILFHLLDIQARHQL